MTWSKKDRKRVASKGSSIDSDQPLRICLFTYRGNPTCGGQGVYIKRLSRALADLGHRVDVASGPPYPILDDDIALHKIPSLDLYNPNDLFRMPRLKELASPINLIEWMGMCSGRFPEPFTSGVRIMNFMRRHADDYDIFHDNQCLAYGLLGIKAIGIPTIATIHHPMTVDRNVDLEAVSTWRKKIRVKRWYSFINMQIRVSRRLSHIITVSEASKGDISREFAIPSHKFRVVANGINTDVFHPLEGVNRSENQIMVTNSADTPLKGLKFLIEAVNSIRKTRDVSLKVIGKPREKGVIEKIVRDLNAHEFISFTGRIPDEDFAMHYAKAAVAVVPSLYEGFGLPAGEAMACRVPVISTTGGALPEVVGDAGVLVPPGDTKALERAIIDLLDNPGKREHLAQAGYDRVKRLFTWHNTARQVADVYREAIDAHC